MDKRAVSLVKEHYNRQADTQTTQKEALKRRRQGEAFPLKQFHNHIKDKLIKRFCYGVNKLLDFCCGRGSDIRKWDFAKVKYCKGVDLSPEEIAEGNQRLCQFKSSRRQSEMKVELESSAVLGSGIYEDQASPYDVVTCFFALHYFTVTEAALHNLFHNVSRNLKKGGYFLCTCPDGKRVLGALMDSKQEGKVDSKMLKINQKWTGRHECFGSAFTFIITDTVTEGDEVIEGSYEYLVFTTPLKQIGARYGLKLITDYGDKELDAVFDQADMDSAFKHFHPTFPGSDQSLELASAMNMAFVFQKVAEMKEGSMYHTLEDVEQIPTTLPPLPPQFTTSRAPPRSGASSKRKQPDDFQSSDNKRPR